MHKNTSKIILEDNEYNKEITERYDYIRNKTNLNPIKFIDFNF